MPEPMVADEFVDVAGHERVLDRFHLLTGLSSVNATPALAARADDDREMARDGH